MAKEERWQIASDAELVRRGRILTILGVVILCLGSLVTVGLMSVAGQTAPQRTSGGPIRIAAPQLASGTSTGGGASSGGAVTGGGTSASETGSGTGSQTSGTTGGGSTGAENPNPGGATPNPGGATPQGPSNIDPNAKPAPGTNVLGLPVAGATPSEPLPPPPDTGQTFDF